MLTSFLSVWLFERFIRDFKNSDRKRSILTLGLSALFLGITAASKVLYCVVAFAMIMVTIEYLFRNPQLIGKIAVFMLLMAVLSLTFFFIFNPSLWYDPIGRIVSMFSFHESYQAGASDIYPWWQPIAWVTRSAAHQSAHFHVKNPLARVPENFIFSCDELIFLLACIGVPRVFKQRRIYLLWFLVAMLFLILWGTKWEQYGCICVVPICISAFYGLKKVSEWMRKAI